MKNMKKLVLAFVTCGIISTVLMGCGSSQSSNSENSKGETTTEVNNKKASDTNKELSGKLTFALWDNNLNEYIEKNDMVGKFKEVYPGVDIEVEKIKDDSEYWNVMKMRASANQLPDIMFNKPFTLSRFRDYLVDLNSIKAVGENELAEGYKVDGKVLGIPATAGYEYIYYWKDMFKEAGVDIPKTWEEFEEATKKLQDFYGKKDPEFAAIAMGLKDEWPDYPFMEFMPSLISGNGQNWNTMAKEDNPFKSGTDINIAYTRVYNLFTSGVLGKNSLGIGYEQQKQLFASKKSAITALGDWALKDIKDSGADVSQLGTFYLPVREKTGDPYNVIVQGDLFMSVTNNSKNQEAAKAFVEWFFSDAWYKDYINSVSSSSCMNNVQKEKDPILAEADSLAPDKVLITYDGGGEEFTKLQSETTFDYKKLGAQMLTPNFNLDNVLNELDKKWDEARKKLDMK